MWLIHQLMTPLDEFHINVLDWIEIKRRGSFRASLRRCYLPVHLLLIWVPQSCENMSRTSSVATGYLSMAFSCLRWANLPLSLKQVWTALHLIPLWINTGRKWMWFYNDSFHTGSIFFQRGPLKAALPSHVYYFLLLWHISIFSFDGFSATHLYPFTLFSVP